MKVVAISDTHNHHDKIVLPDGDILVHSGDATYTGKLEEMEAFVEWFIAQPHKHKIFVPGNHDFICQEEPAVVEELFAGSGVHYLIDRGVTIEGISFYGSPWIPKLSNWAFYLADGSEDLREKFIDGIPSWTDVLVTHGPPYGKLDEVKKALRWIYHSVGSQTLMTAVAALPNLKYHIFGHIHEGHGVTGCYGDGPTFINAAICNRNYDPTNKPIVFDIGDGEEKGDDGQD